MIQAYVNDIAAQMQIQLSQLSVVEDCIVGCLDAHLVKLSYNGRQQSALVYRSELEKLDVGESCKQLEFRIRSALSQLRMKQARDSAP